VYINRHFSFESSEDTYSLMQAYPFAILIAEISHQLYVTHLPLVLHRHEGKKGTLRGHVPLRDPMAECINSASSVLAVFYGCRAYISPSWYKDPGLPTYNFTAVHAGGHFRAVVDEKELHAHLAELTKLHEAKMPEPWHIENAPASYVRPLLKHILGFSIEIESIEGKCKLNQNRSHADRQGVIQGLQQTDAAESRAVAELMKAFHYRQQHAQPLF